MFIQGISVEVPHVNPEGPRDIDNHQVLLPRDWREYGKQIESSLTLDQRIDITLGSGATPGTIIIALGSTQAVESVANAQVNQEVLCLVVGVSTLRQLRGALDAAIAAAE